MASSKAGICNKALSHLGIGKQIANLESERSQEALACKEFYDDARDAVLRDYNWPFATKVATLQLIEEDPTTEWAYSYRYPTDCVNFRKILSGTREDTPATRVPFDIYANNEIYSDAEEAVGQYTTRVDNPTLYPPDFVMAFSFLLAHYIAPRLTGGDPNRLGDRALKLYDMEIRKARANASNEEVGGPEPDAEWIRGR
jgi:hypothetical protein